MVSTIWKLITFTTYGLLGTIIVHLFTSGRSASSVLLTVIRECCKHMNSISQPTPAVSSSIFIKSKKITLNLATSSDESRPICECDRQLISNLYFANPLNTNFDGTQCVKNLVPSPTKAHCCNWDTFMYASYNPDKQCCGSTGVKKMFGGQC